MKVSAKKTKKKLTAVPNNDIGYYSKRMNFYAKKIWQLHDEKCTKKIKL
jgi:hypothetical protein